ncbi:phosphatase PAP2 family protein [Streptomyces filamentosus]|uniref:phosphatase PAP2 family protein n=1 Tax=Streptomyces filamentosus TaxID=67294 RepID=UPI0033D05BBC
MPQNDLLTPTGPTAPPSRTAPAARSWLPALLHLLAFLALYLLAVCTPFGQRTENALLDGDAGAGPAWIYDLSGAAYGSTALPPLEHSAMPTLLAGLALIAAVTVIRRRWWQGCAALGAVVATIGAKEVTRALLPRPGLVGASDLLTEASFPSGHAAVPAALALATALVSSPRLRPYILTAGTLWFAVTAAAVQATYHHRPSDVLGSVLLACACHALATRLLPPAGEPAPAHPRALPAVALALAAIGALLAGARDDSLAQSLTFAAAGFLGAALLHFTATRKTPRPRPADGP